MDTGEQWVGLEDVSAHVKVNKQTIRRWIKGRSFPSHRAGNLLRFKLTEVDAWIREGSGANKPEDMEEQEQPKA